MKFTITLNMDDETEINDIEVEAKDANFALDKAISNLTDDEVQHISSFVMVGVRD